MIALVLALLGSLWLMAAMAGWLRTTPWKGNRKMKKVAEEFKQVIAATSKALDALSEKESADRGAAGKWSKKEILGHLIDSASNNHQRFVRAQLSSEIRLPGYEQEDWVRTQSYQTESWETLVQLWKTFNLHLLHLGAGMPDDRLNTMCFIGTSEPVTLEFIFTDYVRHLKHHLEQILA